MKFERITYSESIEAVNSVMGNKKWFKAGADIIEIEDTDVEKAKTLAKEFVKTTLSEALAENPDYVPIVETNKEIKVSEPMYANPESEKAAILAEIFSCKTIEELKEYEMIAKSNAEYQKAYEMKFKKLN